MKINDSDHKTTGQSEGGILAYLDDWANKGAQIICPSYIDTSPNALFVPVTEEVYLAPERGEVYSEGNEQYRPNHKGLFLLAQKANIEWDHANIHRTDDRTDKLYVSFQAVGGIRKSDGFIYWVKGEYDLDLEVIEEEIREGHLKKKTKWFGYKNNKGKTEQDFLEYVDFCSRRDFLQKRKHKLKLAQSGAMDRVIRGLLSSLKNTYSEEELKKPFIIVRFVPNHNLPEIRRKFLTNAEDACLGLYGSTKRLTAPEPKVIEAEVVQPSNCDSDIEPENNELDDLSGIETDFAISPFEEQVNIIRELASRKDYSITEYEKRARLKLEEFEPDKLLKLYRHLNTLEDKKEAS